MEEGQALCRKGKRHEGVSTLQGVLQARKRAVGKNAPQLMPILIALAQCSQDDKAVLLYQRTLTILETAEPKPAELDQVLEKLGTILPRQKRPAEAEEIYQRLYALREQYLGLAHEKTVRALSGLGEILSAQKRYVDAITVYQHELHRAETALGKTLPPAWLTVLHGLAKMFHEAGRYAEAEAIFRQLLSRASQQAGRPADTDTLRSDLAKALEQQERYAETAAIYQALLTQHKSLTPNYRVVILEDLARVLMAQQRYTEAEARYREALALWEQMVPLAPLVGGSGRRPLESFVTGALGRGTRLRLGEVLEAQGRLSEAEALYREMLAIEEKHYFPSHADLVITQKKLAAVLERQQRFAEERHLREQILDTPEKVEAFVQQNPAVFQQHWQQTLSPVLRDSSVRAGVLKSENAVRFTDTFGLLMQAGSLAQKREQQGQSREALTSYLLALDAYEELDAITRDAQTDVEARQSSFDFMSIYPKTIALLQRLHAEEPDAGYDRQLFAVVSSRQSRLFNELLRQAEVQLWQNDPTFERLKTERATLLTQLFQLRSALAQVTQSQAPDSARQVQIQKSIQEQEQRVAAVENLLWRDYPSFMELFRPRPVTVEQVQKELLRPKEALLTFLLMPAVPPVVFAATPQQFVMRQLTVQQATLEDDIKHVRRIFANASKARDARTQLDILQRLDPHVLHALYQQLIAPVAELLHDAEHILVVADGLLYSLPLELLVTQYDAAQQQRFQDSARRAGRTQPFLSQFDDIQYAGARYRFLYLPGVATLALRRQKSLHSHAVVDSQYDVVAFADPIFFNEAWPSEMASGSTRTTDYSPETHQQLALLRSSRAASADYLHRLPETAEEVQTIAQRVGGKTALFLRQNAQEFALKKLHGTTIKYLVLATHGLLGGEFLLWDETPELAVLSGTPTGQSQHTLHTRVVAERGQPALAFTLVGDLQGETGLLTMKEVIEQLKLQVELAVLSACNTVGEPDSDKLGHGEGFLGMSRAFLFAGARRLLVSHWYIDSPAAKDLVIKTFAYLDSGDSPVAALSRAQHDIPHLPVSAAAGIWGHCAFASLLLGPLRGGRRLIRSGLQCPGVVS